ncbi:MAG TPA: dUTP diphosphatase [Candidatus Faecousia faecigallinarum]|nr:dUTP diphosphatase [Candidatus Faecousia faecigallinarum]
MQVKRLHPNAKLPAYGTDLSAGADLSACLDEPVTIQPGQTAFLPTGLAIAVPRGYAGLVFARSGLGCKRGLAPANKVGVIDADYRGQVHVALLNHSGEPQTIYPGDRIAQLLIIPVLTPEMEEVAELDETARGEGGFGSTGRN